MNRSALPIALITALLLVTACSERAETPEAEEAPFRVYSVNYPLHFFAQRLGGGTLDARLPVPVDTDPADWSPSPETVAEYQTADLILLNGAGYAGWVELATLPESRMIDTSTAFADRYLELDSVITHTHGPTGNHSHSGYAATTWLDPELAVQQMRAIAAALIDAGAGTTPDIEKRASELEADLRALDERLSAAAQSLGERPLLFSHPVYQYLQHRYGLNARSLHWEPDEPPSRRQWMELDELLAEHPARLLIWEAPPADSTLRELEARGIRSIVFNPLGNAPARGDFFSAMNANATALERALASTD